MTACSEEFDFFGGVVGGEGGAHGAGGVEAAHEGLAAMVAGADGDSHLVDEGAEVIVVDALDIEREGALAVGGAVEVEAGNVGEGGGGLFDEGLFVGGDGAEVEGVEPVEGGGEGDASFDVGGAGFVAEGEVVVSGALVGDFFDHLAASAPRGKVFEAGGFSVEDADAGGGVDFVAGKDEESRGRVLVGRLACEQPIGRRR